VKCWVERIVEDYTTKPCTCPSCDVVFAKGAMVRGRYVNILYLRRLIFCVGDTSVTNWMDVLYQSSLNSRGFAHERPAYKIIGDRVTVR
jgi:hypothetical protein